MQLKALAADAVGAALDVDHDEGGCPRRESVARVLRDLLEARGASLEAELIHAAGGLTAPHLSGSPALRDRVGSVLEILVRAGEVIRATGAGGSLCWGRPVRFVSLGAIRAVAVGTSPLTSDTTLTGSGIVRQVPARADAPGLSVCLGTPSFRDGMASLGLVLDNTTSLREFWAAAIAGARKSGATPGASSHTLQRDLPDNARLAEDGVDGQGILIVELDNGPSCLPLPDRETARWLSFAAQYGIRRGHLSAGSLGFPEQIETALALGGAPDDDTLESWSVPAELQHALDAWLGEPPAVTPLVDTGESDLDQLEIINAPASARLIVEAGPGSGKTRVAVERVGALIDADLSPTRIWIVSFTHAATGELRSRVAATLDDPRAALEITISTLDSLAARLRRYGAAGAAADSGFEAAIAEALRLVETADPQLSGFLGRLEHVIVDEVQDLTADRSALLTSIVRRLRPSCGVTLFQDSAQAIYGFADRDAAPSETVAAQLLADPALGFSVRGLHSDHRTRNPALSDLKRRLRAVLLDRSLSADEIYAEVRADIERSSPAARGAVEGQLPSQSSMILFRSRMALIRAASRYWDGGRAFRVRVPQPDPTLAPWIGAILNRCGADELTLSDFENLWEEVWPTPVLLTSGSAWNILKSFQGAGAGPALDIAGIARELAAGRSPPPAATLPILGRRGALLSTVHAVKGLEAEHVVLVLSRAPSATPDERLMEEARILFVGATRPRSTLDVAGGEDLFAKRLSDGRSWVRRDDGHALVELGLDRDVDPCLTEAQPGCEPGDGDARQVRLWSAAEKIVPLTAVRTNSGYELFGARGAERDASFGFLSQDFLNDLRRVGRELHPGGASPARTIRGLHLAGVRTVFSFDPDGGPGRRGRFALAPIVLGLPTVFFNAFNQTHEADASVIS